MYRQGPRAERGFSSKRIIMDTFANYIKATVAELHHVKWPTYQMALLYSLLVLVISGLTAIYAGAFDYIFGQFINYIITLY